MRRAAPILLSITTLGTAMALAACEAADVEPPAPVAEAPAPLQAVAPFSVVIASDPQYWWSEDDLVGEDAAEAHLSSADIKALGNKTNRDQVKAINALIKGATPPGYSAPSAVVVNGDLTSFARPDQWAAYEDQYEDDLLVDVFPGLGNHDYGSNVHDSCGASAQDIAEACGDCAASAGCELCELVGACDCDKGCAECDRMIGEGSNYCGNESRRWMERWIKKHRGQIEAYDPGSVAYSFVKSGIRFIQLHNHPTYEEPDFHISKSIDFLRNQLADAVGEGQRAVINMHDFGEDMPTTDAEFIGAITGFEYNILGIFSGHVHEQAGHIGDIAVNGVHIPWFRTGSATYSYFLLVQFDGDSMDVSAVHSEGGVPAQVTAYTTSDCDHYDVGNCASVKAPSHHPYPVNPCAGGTQPDVAPGPASSYRCAVVPAQRITDGHTEDKAEKDDHFGRALATADFNGDGYADLAVGAPYEDINGADDAGAVNVIYGSILGLTSGGDQLWHQDSPGVVGSAENDDRFGHALAAGDFNRDGFDDLAIGAPGEDIGGDDDAGSVYILYGSPSGLTSAGNQGWDQDSPNVAGGVEGGDHFGGSLAAGDFTGDGYADLAIGAPDEDVDGHDDGGAVHVFRGTAAGLSAAGDPMFHENSPNVAGSVEEGDRFGWSLAAGNFDGDGYADLAIGAPYEDLAGHGGGGAVHVFRGTAAGLSAVGDPMFHQDSPNVADAVEDGDHFGYALASGDFDGDGKADLAIGVPHEDFAGHGGGGVVHVFRGTASGLSAAGDPLLNQDTPNVGSSVADGDHFGWALASGDFDGDGKADLAVGAPHEDIDGQDDAGVTHLFRGTATGLSTLGDPAYTQDSPGVEGSVEDDDRSGYALAAGDFDGDGKADLAIGAPGEDISRGGDDNDGHVNVLYGSSSGVIADRDQVWHQAW
ncbi:hypothetical protein [Sorangium sp. So ce341]|uniref:hypothetical protein n=1 Tax=Sorangium sp. So ce341 TaxID=3133302 RepID=UPI003F5FEB44